MRRIGITRKIGIVDFLPLLVALAAVYVAIAIIPDRLRPCPDQVYVVEDPNPFNPTPIETNVVICVSNNYVKLLNLSNLKTNVVPSSVIRTIGRRIGKAKPHEVKR